MKEIKHTISLLVSNKPGVLTRIALIFARRGYNIDSLVVSTEQKREYSRMNIEATGDEKTLSLMLNQLNRLVDVIHAVDHAGEDVIQRELALIKLECPPAKRTELLQIADTFRSRPVDISDQTLTLQVTGDSSKLDAFVKMVESFTIMELVRTGKVIMSRGSESTT